MDTIIQTLTEEIFCLNFELETLSDSILRKKAERWVPKFLSMPTESEHLYRYDFAKNFVKDKKVLDIAGGSGYGSYLLAKEGLACEIISCDLSNTSVRYANHRFYHERVKRLLQDAEEYRKDNYFDVIVSFETVEHLSKYDDFLNNMAHSLTAEGILIISTPVVNKTTTSCHNPYHVIEWGFDDFRKLISKYFEIKETYLQNIRLVQPNRNVVTNMLFRILSKIFNIKKKKQAPMFQLEKYSNQYDVRKIYSGYQILICKKRR